MRLINAADLKFLSNAEIENLMYNARVSLYAMWPYSPEYRATVDSIHLMECVLEHRKRGYNGPCFC